MDVSVFVNKLINNKQFFDESFARWENEHDFIEDSITGVIDATLIDRYINFAQGNDRAALLLEPLLMYRINADSITDAVFGKLMAFPKKKKRNYAIALAHNQISFCQLLYINKMHVCSEAFCQLIFAMCECDCFSPEDVRILMRESDVSKIIVLSSIDLIRQKLGYSNKLQVVIDATNAIT